MDEQQNWLIANWKMHGTRERAAAYAFAFNAALQSAPATLHGVFCPPAVYLPAAQLAMPGNARLRLGGQDCHAYGDGAYTGELSARMLADVGAQLVILGHSERRSQCHETCEVVLAKAQAAVSAGLMPVLCIGESAAERDAGQTNAVLQKQAENFAGLQSGSYMVAYEPLWAIGSGRTPQMPEIASAHQQIKSTLGSTVPVLYGGSVKPSNIREILAVEGVCGALIGGASLEIDSMRAMVEHASALARKE